MVMYVGVGVSVFPLFVRCSNSILELFWQCCFNVIS